MEVKGRLLALVGKTAEAAVLIDAAIAKATKQ